MSYLTLVCGDSGGAEGTFPDPSRDGSEGGEEAGHMPTGFTYVTEKHSFLVKWTLTHLAQRIIREGADKGGHEGLFLPFLGKIDSGKILHTNSLSNVPVPC